MIIESYRGINILQWQDQHQPAGRLSIGFIPPDRGPRGAFEGGPTSTIETVKREIDTYIDKGPAAYWRAFPNHRRPTEYRNTEDQLNTEIQRVCIKEGQIWEPCEKCGKEPAYLPLHLCEKCWPK